MFQTYFNSTPEIVIKQMKHKDYAYSLNMNSFLDHDAHIDLHEIDQVTNDTATVFIRQNRFFFSKSLPQVQLRMVFENDSIEYSNNKITSNIDNYDSRILYFKEYALLKKWKWFKTNDAYMKGFLKEMEVI